MGILERIMTRYKWGLLSRTYIELYNYAHDHSAIYHRFFRTVRRLSLIRDRRRSGRTDLDPDSFNILFLTFGGIGESVIEANYIHYFKQRFNGPNICIHVADVHRPDIREAIFCGLHKEGIVCFGMEEEPCFRDYDAVVRIVRYPVILDLDDGKMERTAPELKGICDTWRGFEKTHGEMIRKHPYLDHIGIAECLEEGKKRFQQADIGDLLKIPDLDYPIHVPDTEVLTKFGICHDGYITVSRDTGFGSTTSTKLWSEESYNALISIIRGGFPNLKIVFVGDRPSKDSILAGADIDLRGRTDFEELMDVLNGACLHISGEGLSVHLRHVMSRKKSVVIFGSTSAEFYGYSENINISSPCRNGPCEWKNDSWSERCTLTDGEPPCLSAIEPQDVYSRISGLLSDLTR